MAIVLALLAAESEEASRRADSSQLVSESIKHKNAMLGGSSLRLARIREGRAATAGRRRCCLALRGGGDLLTELSLGIFGDFGLMDIPTPSATDIDHFARMKAEGDMDKMEAELLEALQGVDEMSPEVAERIHKGEESLGPVIFPDLEAKMIARNKRLNEEKRAAEEMALQKKLETKEAKDALQMEESKQADRMQSKKSILKKLKLKKALKREEIDRKRKEGFSHRPMVSSPSPLPLNPCRTI